MDTAAWTGTITAVAMAVGFLAQITLAVMAKLDAAKEARQRKADAEAAKVAAEKEAAQRKADAEAAQRVLSDTKRAAAAAAEEAKSARKVVAEKAEEVKQVLAATDAVTQDKLDHNQAVTDQIHRLGNSAMTVQMKFVAELRREKADKSRDPKDIEAAQNAEKALKENEANQPPLPSPTEPPPWAPPTGFDHT